MMAVSQSRASTKTTGGYEHPSCRRVLVAAIVVLATLAAAGCGAAKHAIRTPATRSAPTSTSGPTSGVTRGHGATHDVALQTYFASVAATCARTLSGFSDWSAVGNPSAYPIVNPASATSADALATALRTADQDLGQIHAPSPPYEQRLQEVRTTYLSFATTLTQYSESYVSVTDAGTDNNPDETQVLAGELLVSTSAAGLEGTFDAKANLRACDVTTGN